MNEKHVTRIAEELSLKPVQVLATAALLADGGTVPFIARYRKEATGTLDEVVITAIRDRIEQLRELDDRRASILQSLTDRKMLTDELKAKILATETLATLEDVYLPYRPKRRTRAMVAREKGLEPLADIILQQQESVDPLVEAAKFVTPSKTEVVVPAPAAPVSTAAAADAPAVSEQVAPVEHQAQVTAAAAEPSPQPSLGVPGEGASAGDGARPIITHHPEALRGPQVVMAAPPPAPEEDDRAVPDAAAALAGARDIIAERINDDVETRAQMRLLFQKQGTIHSEKVAGKEEEGAKFKDYFDWTEPVASAPSHRVLAIRRGSAEGYLIFQIRPPEEAAMALLEKKYLAPVTAAANACREQMKQAIHDSFKRLLCPSMETEARLEAKKRADAAAIEVFAQNLRQLLLAPPLGQKRVLAIDPGFRTGCKTVALDAQGKLVAHDVIFPDQGEAKTTAAVETIKKMVETHQIEAIAIGNGTASRETESFVRKLGLPSTIPVVMVSESGASIYSASATAREEFGDVDLTVRGAVSIGRRLMDPLAELVKLDPKSIGVGQYQHDVDQNDLRNSLDDVVVSAVNAVGVEVNTASKQLLSYVSGLNLTLAENIVKFRNEMGPFKTRQELTQVPRFGPKTFEQAAGFLRVAGSENPLDESAVHPESYAIVDKMATDLAVSIKDLMRDPDLRAKIEKEKYVTEKFGLPTLTDIVAELAKPGRDPRDKFEPFQFAEGINKLEDVKPGMKVPGIVTNVTAFGAFVDIGVHQDGLIHISQLADRFVKDPNDVVKVAQRVEVTVLEVDLPRKRIGLTMKRGQGAGSPQGGGERERRTGPVPPRPPRQNTEPRQQGEGRQQGPRPPMPPRAPRPAYRPAAPAPSLGAVARPPNRRPAPQNLAPERPVDPNKEGWFTAALRDAKKKE